MHIRKMGFKDLDTVTSIEQDLCEYPWTKGVFSDCLKNYDCFIIEDKNNEILGYAMISCFLNESHLLNIGIRKDSQGKKLGNRLMQYIIEQAKAKKAELMYLEVRKDNIRAVNLYKKLGFSQIGIRKEYYLTKNGKEDALVFLANI